MSVFNFRMRKRVRVTKLFLGAGIFGLLLLGAQKGNCIKVMPGIIGDIREIEFSQIQYDVEGEPYYGYLKGSLPILISAPHGAKHFRKSESRWRGEDAYTSSLAIVLGRLTGAHVLYVKNKTSEDPNNDPDSRYKRFLKRVVEETPIKFVLDLHGMKGGRPSKIDIGIMSNEPVLCSCPTYREIVEKTFKDFEPTVFNQPFSAHGESTITNFARSELGIEAAQVEINARYRIVESKATGSKADPDNVLDLVMRLKKLILSINQKITETIAPLKP